MSWLPDPTKFLRRSYRKGDGENQDKVPKNKAAKSSSTLKHSSLYSLMQASSSNSLDKSAEEENPSLHGVMDSSTSYGHINAISDSTDPSLTQVRADELILIRHAANILISNVPPSSHAHTHEYVADVTRDDALQASPNAREGDVQHLHASDDDIQHASSGAPNDNIDGAQHASHAQDQADSNALYDLARAKSLTAEYGVTKEGRGHELGFPTSEPHAERDPPAAANEGSMVEEVSSPHASEGGHTDVTEKGFSLVPTANSDNEDTDESECKVIAEDPAALLRVSEEGKLPSSTVVRERKKGKGSRKLSKRKILADQGSKIEPNTRRNSVPVKDAQPSNRKSSRKGEGKMHRSTNNLQTEHSKESFRVGKDREPISKQGQIIGRDNDESSFSDKALTSAEQSMGDDLSDRETPYSYMREPTFNHRTGSPRVVTRREYSLMPQESFAFQDIEGIGERARVSVGRERDTTRRSPTFLAERKELDLLSMQLEAYRARDNEVMEERARISVGHDTPKMGSRRSPLMVSSPLMLQFMAEQDGESIGDTARVSVGHNTAELDMRRSPYAARRALQSPPMSPIHQTFSLQEDKMRRERSRTSVGYDHTDLTSRRPSPWMDARRDLITPSTPRRYQHSQVTDEMGERARMSTGYDASESGAWKRSPSLLAKEPHSPMSPRHAFSLQDNEVMGEAARLSMGREYPDFGSRRRSPYLSARRESNSPLMHHPFLLQEREERARISVGRDDWEFGSRRRSPYIARRRDQSLLPMVSSQRFYLQEEDVMSVYDMPPSPFSASQASLLLERGGSMFGDKPVSTLPNSPPFFSQNSEHFYEPSSPMVTSKHYASRENQQTYRRPTSPYYGVLSHEGRRAYQGEDPSPRQGIYSERGMQRGYMNDDIESANPRASFYYKECEENYLSRDNSSPLMSPRRDALDVPLHLDEEEVLYEEHSENDELSVSSASRNEENESCTYDEVAMVQHFLREQRDMQLLQEDGGCRSQYDERLSESSTKSHLILKQRSNASSKAEAMPKSPQGSSVSSEKRMMKKLKEAQAKVAEVRRARRGFEEMVVEMVGSGGEDAVQDLLDLEEFVGTYESLAGGGLFKGVVDQFFHELCCELSQPVSEENDAVLSMALFRLDQTCPSS